MTGPDCVALIPARAGSKRVVGKNVRPLAGHPLIAYTIAAARASGVFRDVLVSTDGEETADLARACGAEVPFLRPAEFAQDRSPDIEWVRHALEWLAAAGRGCGCFAILRPTSPFRLPETIGRAWRAFLADGRADSLRAVERCAQHPAKMWYIDGKRMRPVLANPDPTGTPWHSTPYQALPEVWAQNASLEIAWTRVPMELGSIAGKEILPFVSEGYEGFDINHPEDWVVAEYLIERGLATLPSVP